MQGFLYDMVQEVIGSRQHSWVMAHVLQDYYTASLRVTAREKVLDIRLTCYHKKIIELAVLLGEF